MEGVFFTCLCVFLSCYRPSSDLCFSFSVFVTERFDGGYLSFCFFFFCVCICTVVGRLAMRALNTLEIWDPSLACLGNGLNWTGGMIDTCLRAPVCLSVPMLRICCTKEKL